MSDGMRALKEEVQAKIRNLLLEFSEGKVSNEQFNILYERFSGQLELALGVIDAKEAGLKNEDMSTIAVKLASYGKARGLAIYHHRSGMFIETLGNFDIPPGLISPTLNELSQKLEQDIFTEPITRKLENGMWLIFMAREFTTAVVIFKNEPAPSQIRELERLLHDFEIANQDNLSKMDVDKEKLAKPFIGFVRQKKNS